MDALGGPVQTFIGVLVLLAAGLASAREIWRKGLRPMVTVAKLLIHRWEDLATVVVIAHQVEDIAAKVAGIEESIRPTNGDQRSVSDRLDTVKRDVGQMKDDQHLVRDEVYELRRHQSDISNDVQTIKGRQEQHREATQVAGRAAERTADALSRHDVVDERNFAALAEWSTQFKNFRPIQFEPYDQPDQEGS